MARDTARELRFTERLIRLGAACRQELDELTLEVYCEALCYQVGPEEWDRFTREAVASGRFSWFPKVAELLDALQEFRGAPPLEREAIEAYERVLASPGFSPQGGAFWSLRGAVGAAGRAAGEAFLVSGGSNAFASSWDESRRRGAFVKAYVQAAREQPELRMLPKAEQKALPAASQPLSDGEAKAVFRKLEQTLGPLPPMRRIKHVAKATDERLAELKRQAEAILAEEGDNRETSASHT